MNRFILNNGGWIVSADSNPTVRFETPPGSGLPEALRKLGYTPVHAGEVERLLPLSIEAKELNTCNTVRRDVLAPTMVEIYQLEIFNR